MLLYKYFTVTGSANDTVYDTGLTSSKEEPKRLVKMFVSVSGQAGNFVQGWLEREKNIDIIDYVLDTTEASGTNAYKSTVKINTIDVGVDIPVGDTFKAAILCGATNKDLYGVYVYEVTGV